MGMRTEESTRQLHEVVAHEANGRERQDVEAVLCFEERHGVSQEGVVLWAGVVDEPEDLPLLPLAVIALQVSQLGEHGVARLASIRERGGGEVHQWLMRPK